MSIPPQGSASVSELLQLTQAGDQLALNALIERSGTRLRGLARHMLNGSPALRRWTGSDDVLQISLIRLVRALEAVKPDSSRDFFGLAALQMRRELIDLARHFFGPQGHGANLESGTDERLLVAGRPADSNQPEVVAQWAELHEHMGQLEESHREIVDLIFYQGLSQAETAEVLGVSVRTVQRRWHAVLLKLNEFLEGSLGGESAFHPALLRVSQPQPGERRHSNSASPAAGQRPQSRHSRQAGRVRTAAAPGAGFRGGDASAAAASVERSRSESDPAVDRGRGESVSAGLTPLWFSHTKSQRHEGKHSLRAFA